MQVWVWDSLGIQSLQEAQWSEGWIGCRDLWVGASAAFSYRVGDSGDPSTLNMNNFAGFSVRKLPAYPPFLAEAMVGGRWLGSIVATENTREVPINFLMHPNLGLPAGLTGNEPVGRIVRSIGTGNPLSLVRYEENPSLSPYFVGIRGSLATTELATEQSLGQSGRVCRAKTGAAPSTDGTLDQEALPRQSRAKSGDVSPGRQPQVASLPVHRNSQGAGGIRIRCLRKVPQEIDGAGGLGEPPGSSGRCRANFARLFG